MRFVFILFTAAQVLLCTLAQASEQEKQRRFLVIYSESSTLLANIEIAEGLRQELDQALSPHFEIFAEFRETQNFPDPINDQYFVEMLERKYAGQPIDLVIAIGPKSAQIVSEHREVFAAGVPVVAGGLSENSVLDPLPDDWNFVLGSFDFEKTVALARRMQPRAQKLVVFTGSADFDARWQGTAREQLADAGLKVEYVSGLTLAEFQETAEALDKETILIILTIFEDSSGAHFIPAVAASTIAARSLAPSWGVYSSFVGGGVVGGVFGTFKSMGQAIGSMALDVLNRDSGIEQLVSVPAIPVVDWEQIRRYGLDESLLPVQTALLNYNPSVWERYRLEIMVILGVLLAQTGTIFALAIQGRRRQVAERELATKRIELAQFSRVSQLGELSGAITHELSQPLASILANAEAGRLLLEKSPADLEEVAEILQDIAVEDQRASNIIDGLRNLMSGRSTDHNPVDLNAVVASVERLTRSELTVRGVRLVVRKASHPLSVLGNLEQLQQVLINLIINGADAMENCPVRERKMEIETARRQDGWCQISVRDNGTGLAGHLAQDPFVPFLTTKKDGMGIGLSVCRTIAEVHGGTLSFEETERGAHVVFALPPA